MNKSVKQFIYFLIAFFIVISFLLPNNSNAQVNQSFNFTGKVTNTDGSEISDGVYDFSFALYTQPSGGTAIWSEVINATSSFSANISSGVAGSDTVIYTYASANATSTLRVGQYLSNSSTNDSALIVDFDTSANTITVAGTDVWSDSTAINNRPFVEGGVIDVDLGAINGFSGVDFNQTLYLQVIFNGETMKPRKTINSVVQAFNADTLDGFHSSDFANLSDNSTVTGEWTFNNIVNIATSSNQTALTITQNGSGDIVDFKVGTTTSLAVLNDGRVQIGNYYFPVNHGAPGYVLKTNITGNLYWDVDFAGSGGGSGLWASSTDNSFVFQADVGQIVVIGNNATSAPTSAQFEVEGFSWFDDVGISNQQLLRLYDADSSNYTAIRATDTIISNYILTLPADAGSAGETLITDGSGNLTWGNPSSAGTVNAAAFAGQIPFYLTASNEVTATSAIYIDPNNSYIGIGTTSPVNLLSVNGTADFDELCFGNSCITSWSGAGAIDGSGSSGYIAIWQDADTLAGEQYLSAARGGLSQDFSGSTGFVYFDSGTAISSSTIAISNTDLTAGTGLNFNGSALAIDAGGDWTGTFDGQDGTYYLNAVNLNNFIIPFANALAGTTTDALSEGSNNLYWTDGRFDTRLSATTSLPNIVSLNGLQTIGTITSGIWNGDILGVDYGGTGQDSNGWTGIAYINSGIWEASSTLSSIVGGTGINSYAQGDILYASSAGTLSKLPIGSESDILVVSSSGIPDWVATSSLGLDIQNMTGILTVEHGGTGQDFSSTTGFIYLDSGVALASSSIAITMTDLAASTGINLNGNLLTLDNTGNWVGTFDGLEGSDIFTLSDWYATTSAPQLSSLLNLTSIGNITAGTWQANVIGVSYGGTGRSSWTQYSIPYMTSSNTMGEIAIGSSTYILSVNASGNGYEWVEASSTGVTLTQEQVDDYVDALINDPDSQHTRITITYDDIDNAMDFVVDADLSQYDNSTSQFFSTTTDILASNYGGIGQDSSSWTGFGYIDGGSWSASNTISAVNLDSIVMLANENISLLNNDSNFIDVSGARSALSATSPLAYNSSTGVFSIQMASSSESGYLSATDWTTFNNKQNALSLGNLTENTSSLLTITGGTNAVVGNVTIEVDDDLSNYDNSTTAFISRGGISATSPISYNSGTGVISLGVVPVANGGTGTTTFEAYSLLYASSANVISEILAGTEGEVLKMVAGVPTWGTDLSGGSVSLWATSSDQLMIHPNPDTQVVLVGASATSSSGYIFEVAGNSLFGGSISAQDLSLINALNVSSGGTGSSTPSGLLYGDGAGNIVSVANNSANWNTAYSWGDHSIANYFSTTTDILNVAYGGTGRTAWTANSLVYADADNSLGQITIGSEGEALVIQGGVPTWSTTSPGTAHSLLSTLHSGTEATSTQVRGDMLVVNSANNYTRMALGASGYILRSNGLDPEWVPTINITELGTITTGAWQADAIGLAYGGTGSTTAAGARENLDLDEIYNYAINSTATSGWVWMSDGAGRGEWVASTTLMANESGTGVSKFIGTTTLTTNGLFATGTLQGYAAANDICNFEYKGSHFCRTYDILVTIEQDDISDWGTVNADAWIAEGPPGFTDNSNDCNGWNESDIDFLGAFWVFNGETGGYGKLVNCTQIKSLACCIRE